MMRVRKGREVLAALEELRPQGLPPDVFTYSAVTCACGTSHMAVRDLQLVGVWLLQDLPPGAFAETGVHAEHTVGSVGFAAPCGYI